MKELLRVEDKNDTTNIGNDDNVAAVDGPLQQNNLKEEEDSQELQQQPSSSSMLSPKLLSKEEMIQLLSERHILQLTPEEDELLDPIERTIRYMIPIPKYYYWDVLKIELQKTTVDDDDDDNTDSSEVTATKDDSDKNAKNIIITSDQIPYRIKSWHLLIGICDTIGTVLDRNIAQPLASYMGLTGPRFHEVINSMTPNEMHQSQRIVQQRQLQDQIHRQV